MNELLERVGWSQAEFARRVGVTANTVSKWCKGQPSSVALAYLELVDRLLNRQQQ